MKRTLTILTAALFASAIAVPVFAQSGGDTSAASPAAEASPSSEQPAKKHHHHGHKKKSADSGSMESPAATPSDSTTK